MSRAVPDARAAGIALKLGERRRRAARRPATRARRELARALWFAGPLRSSTLLPALRQSQAWPVERMRDLQLELLRGVVGTPSGPPLSSIDDLALLPILRRDDLERRSDRGLGRRVSTSGTGGSPQRVLWSAESMRWQDAVDDRSREWLGVKGWDRRVWICCNPAGGLRRARLAATNTRIVAAAEIASDRNASRRLADLLAADPPDLLQGVSNALATVADELAATGRRLPGTRWLSAGNHLTPWYRRRIARVAPGPIAERYAAVEVGLIAASCELGSLHVNAENLLVEVVADDGSPLRDRPGEVLVTSLRNRTAPLIRYAVGDLAILRSTPCGCGRTLPVIEPAGRAGTSGTGGLPADARSIFDAIGGEGIREARLVRSGGGIEVEVEIEPGADWGRLLGRIERDVARLLDAPLPIRARAVERIDVAGSGKVRHIEAAGRAHDPAPSMYA